MLCIHHDVLVVQQVATNTTYATVYYNIVVVLASMGPFLDWIGPYPPTL